MCDINARYKCAAFISRAGRQVVYNGSSDPGPVRLWAATPYYSGMRAPSARTRAHTHHPGPTARAHTSRILRPGPHSPGP